MSVVEKLELVCFALLERIAYFIVGEFLGGHLVDRAGDVFGGRNVGRMRDVLWPGRGA